MLDPRARFERLEELLVESMTTGLDPSCAAELAELRLELGPAAARVACELEDAAAKVAMLGASPLEALPSSLRQRVQDDAFRHFERVAGSPREGAASTTTGANVLSMEEVARPAPRSTLKFPMWAAAAALLVAVGGAVAFRGTDPAPAAPASPGRPRPPRATLTWPSGSNSGTLKVDELGERGELGEAAARDGLRLYVEDHDERGLRWVDAGPLTPLDKPAEIRFRTVQPLAAPVRFILAPESSPGQPAISAAQLEGPVAGKARGPAAQ